MKLLGRDITNVFFRPSSELVLPEKKESIIIRNVEADEILRNSIENPNLELSKRAASLVESENIFCYAAFVEEKMVAYCYFAINDLEPILNSGGWPFGGIGIRMPEDVVFSFKGFALPESRGLRLVPLCIATASKALVSENGWSLVTADVKNIRSAKMFASIGLDKTGILLKEYWVVNRSIYKIPKHLQLGDPNDKYSKVVELYTPEST